MGFPGGSDLKESARNIRNPGLIPGSGRSPGEGKGNPLQYSCLENPMDRGAWQAIVHGVTKESDITEQLTLSLSKNPTAAKSHVRTCSGTKGLHMAMIPSASLEGWLPLLESYA